MIGGFLGDRVDTRRRRQLDRASGVLRDCLATPLPDRSTRATDIPILAVDFETTGLDPATDHLLSVGFVEVNGAEIDLGTAGRFVIRAHTEVGQSATVHGLTDDMLAAGVALEEAITATVRALRGRVMLAHFVAIEETFLDRACQALFGAGLPLLSIDTMILQDRILDETNSRGSRRLWGARERYGLPVYRAHEALTDALACAELYLAQLTDLGEDPTLRKLWRWSH